MYLQIHFSSALRNRVRNIQIDHENGRNRSLGEQFKTKGLSVADFFLISIHLIFIYLQN